MLRGTRVPMRTSRRAFSYELAPEISGVVVSQYFCAHSHARLSVIKALTFFEPEHFKPKNGEHVRGVQFNCDLSATNSRMKIMKIISSSMSRSLRARAPRALCGPGICRLSRPPACFYCPRGPSCPPPPAPRTKIQQRTIDVSTIAFLAASLTNCARVSLTLPGDN